MILPGTGRGTAGEAGGGGGSPPAHRHEVYTARKLRRKISLPEVLLWRHLRSGRAGARVRRQHPIGTYVGDFYSAERRLVIEIDGKAHYSGEHPENDEGREAFLLENGYKVARYTATEVLNDAGAVAASIAVLVESPLHHASHGSPPRAGEDFA